MVRQRTRKTRPVSAGETRLYRLIMMMQEFDQGDWTPSGPNAMRAELHEIEYNPLYWGTRTGPETYSVNTAGMMLMDERFTLDGFKNGTMSDYATVPAYQDLKSWHAIGAFFECSEFRAMELLQRESPQDVVRIVLEELERRNADHAAL